MKTKALKQYLELLQLSGIDSFFISKPEPIEDNTNKRDLLQLAEEYKNCDLCSLKESRIKLVYGEGNQNSKLLLIGEAPGANENETGKVFVGRAGQLLTKMLAAIHIERKDVYITNVVKCRPPNNRNPKPEEIEACSPYLKEQIDIIKPQLILLLGRVAAESLLNQNKSLKNYRLTTHEFLGIKTYVTYHPSALLRNPGWKKFAWIDLQKLEIDYNNLGR